MLIFAFQLPGLGPVSDFFANALKFLSVGGSFGVGVILLTVIFRVVILPLTIKQTKSMIAMQKLQPQLKEIQKKHKDDREKMGQELMKVYKENKVNPLGGCLPLLIQMPILFALFDVLNNVTKYRQLSNLKYSFLGIDNIIATGKVMWSGGTFKYWNEAGQIATRPPYAGGEYVQLIILVVLTILTGYVSAKMMTTDPKQAKMMMLMPLVFGFFAWVLPAGVTVYIIVLNALTIVQQYVQLSSEGFYGEKRRQREKEGKPAAALQRYSSTWRSRLSNALKALRGEIASEEPLVKEPKKTGTSAAGTGEERPAGKKVRKQAGGKPSGKGVKKENGKKPAGAGASKKQDRPGARKATAKDYPAKKKGKAGR